MQKVKEVLESKKTELKEAEVILMGKINQDLVKKLHNTADKVAEITNAKWSLEERAVHVIGIITHAISNMELQDVAGMAGNVRRLQGQVNLLQAMLDGRLE